VLSEGLNLQDATRLINYDVHWNPVRLMQRIGRVDRRMNPAIEEDFKREHPEAAGIRGTIAYWNFLPPDELNKLLTLYKKVRHKTLRISKTFGIEGKKLLHPDDDYDALKNFNHQYEGDTTPVEKMHLEFQDLVRENPDLEKKIDTLPGRVFSGKENPKQGIKAVFLCYRIPKPDLSAEKQEADGPEWTEEAGETVWCLYNAADGSIAVDASSIIDFIRCTPETARKCRMEHNDLIEIRKTVEKYIKNSYLKSLQAPIGVKPILKAWMELS
jgi:superfamily II DNA/RNA helicase